MYDHEPKASWSESDGVAANILTTLKFENTMRKALTEAYGKCWTAGKKEFYMILDSFCPIGVKRSYTDS